MPSSKEVYSEVFLSESLKGAKILSQDLNLPLVKFDLRNRCRPRKNAMKNNIQKAFGTCSNTWSAATMFNFLSDATDSSEEEKNKSLELSLNKNESKSKVIYDNDDNRVLLSKKSNGII